MIKVSTDKTLFSWIKTIVFCFCNQNFAYNFYYINNKLLN